jgi:excisionase family DNA binding protein
VTLEGERVMKSRQGRSGQSNERAASRSRELVDIEWVARRLGVSVRHVRRLVAERRIPFVKWGHLLRFDPDEIETWIDSVRIPPAS